MILSCGKYEQGPGSLVYVAWGGSGATREFTENSKQMRLYSTGPEKGTLHQGV